MRTHQMTQTHPNQSLSESEIDSMLDRALATTVSTGRLWLLEPHELDDADAPAIAPATDTRCRCAAPRAYFVPGVCGRCHGETVRRPEAA